MPRGMLARPWVHNDERGGGALLRTTHLLLRRLERDGRTDENRHRGQTVRKHQMGDRSIRTRKGLFDLLGQTKSLRQTRRRPYLTNSGATLDAYKSRMHATVTLGSRRQSEGFIRNTAHEYEIGKSNTLEHLTLRVMQFRLERHV